MRVQMNPTAKSLPHAVRLGFYRSIPLFIGFGFCLIQIQEPTMIADVTQQVVEAVGLNGIQM